MLTKQVRRAIITSFHNGLSRSEIAIKYGISTGSVSNIIKEFEEALAIFDLTEIRKDAKAIHKCGFTIKKLATVARFMSRVKEHSMMADAKDSPDFEGFLIDRIESVSNFNKFCDDHHISPSIVLIWIKDFQDFAPKLQTLSTTPPPPKPASVSGGTDNSLSTASTPLIINPSRNANIPFMSAVSSYIEHLKYECNKLENLKNSLQESIKRLTLEEAKLRSNIGILFQKESWAMQYLAWFYKLKNELDTTYGVKIEGIKHFASLINECAKRGYNVKEILSELEQLQLAPIRIMILEREIEILSTKKAAIESNLKFYEMKYSVYYERMPIVIHLENIGFGYDQLIWLTKIIERISKIQRISLMEATNKLLGYIEQHYFREYF